MAPNIEVIIGTYEEFLVGYKLITEDEKKITLKQSFADKSHAGAIKCLAVKSHWVATGSTDDRIIVYDMRTRKQSEVLLSHEGTINTLTFTPDDTYLFSGGDDGRMIATHVDNWTTNAAWKKAHDGKAVTHISCHPSGKLALTLGTDLILRTWNLVKGRVAYKTNLKNRNSLGRVAECLSWSPSGDYFSISGQRIIEIWSIQKANVVRSQKTQSKPTCISWIDDDTCVAGLEDGKIIWFTLNEGEKEKLIEVSESRIKDMIVWDNTLVTASSSGDIIVWKIDASRKKLEQIAATNIGCRPTCIGILDLKQFGDQYNLDKVEIEKKTIIQNVRKRASPPRGVVTIEYENDDKTSEADPSDKSSDEENEHEDLKSSNVSSNTNKSSDEGSEYEAFRNSDDSSSEGEQFSKPKKAKTSKMQQNKPKQLKIANKNKKKRK